MFCFCRSSSEKDEKESLENVEIYDNEGYISEKNDGVTEL